MFDHSMPAKLISCCADKANLERYGKVVAIVAEFCRISDAVRIDSL